MAGGGYGGGPWGGTPWGGATSGGGVSPEHIPKTQTWNAFDLQPVDMDRVPVFIEVETFGQSSQFFLASFNMCSGGAYPTDAAILDIDVPVVETYTVEFRLTFGGLPPNWSDPVNEHILLGVNNAGGPCTTFMFSQAGVAYTGAFHFSGVGNDLVFDHLLNPAGVTLEERHLQLLPGSDVWFTDSVEYIVRFVSDASQALVYLFITRADEIDVTGHVLRALLPPFYAADATFPPIDRIAVSVRGTALNQSCLELFTYTMAYRALVPNLPPRAILGGDQAARLCSIVQLDGSGSFDPEGEELVYEWRLIDAPDTSQFVFVGGDGGTLPEAPPTGFTDQFFSVELALENTVEAIQVGDVIMVGGVGYTISTIPPGDTVPFYVLVEKSQIPDDLVSAQYKLIRQAGVSSADEPKPTFYPDQPGFYLFDLRVFDGSLWSSPTGLQRATMLVNVLESPLPRGCTPDVRFLFDYLSDFWQLVEDNEKLAVFWSALAQTAATELFTLWQHEYSKSIRDIQRTFVRRWLHYDLVLGEPIPELTTTKAVWGGVYSSTFSELRMNNRKLGLSSSVFEEDLVLTFQTLDPVDPEQFRAGLERTLRQYGDSFSVELIVRGSGLRVLRVDADFEFTVTTETTTLFTAGDQNGTAAGQGVLVGGKTLRTDRSLQGLDLRDAFLVVNGEAFVIDRVVTQVGDDIPESRVVVRHDLPATLPDGSDPSNPSVSYRICGWVQSELLDFWRGLVTEGDQVDFEVVEESTEIATTAQESLLVSTVAYGAAESMHSRLPVDFGPLGHYLTNSNFKVRLAGVVRRGRIPVDALVVDVPTLQEKIVLEEDESTLRRNLDFFIEEFREQNSIRFVSGQNGSPDVFEGQRPPSRLWAEYTYLDNKPTIEANFGLAVELTQDQLSELPDTVDYLSAVTGLLYAFTNGPTMRNLRIGTQILLGLPYVEEAGTIEELRKDLLGEQGRILIRDTGNPEVVRSYTFPKVLELEVNPATGRQYAVGDTVERFAPLVEGAEIVDYVKDPKWFEGIVNQGVFYEVEKFHTFLVRVDSRAFNLSSLLFARNFILKIKPTYTYPKFIVQLLVSDEDGDEISVNDTITYGGTLTLSDSICRLRAGSDTIFDQPRAAGGGYRNQFDGDDDPLSVPVYPVAESVYWAYDKEFNCPSDVLLAVYSESFLVDFTPQYDSVFAFDAGVTDPNYGMGASVNETFNADEVPPASIDGTGFLLTLDDPVVDTTGMLWQVRFALLGSPAAGELDYELVVRNDTAAVEVVVPFTARNNVEIVSSISLAVTAADQVQVRLRYVGGGSTTPAWTQALCRVGSALTWTYDMGVNDPNYGLVAPMSAGTYTTIRQLSP